MLRRLNAAAVSAPPRPVQSATWPVGTVERSDEVRTRRHSGRSVRAAGLLAFVFGVGVLSRAWTVPGTDAAAYAWYWCGMATCYVGALAFALPARPRVSFHLLALGSLGALMFLPTYLRSPAFPIFQDELLHVQTLQLMQELHTTRVPMTFFQIPGDYPGLELTGLALIYSTGLSLDEVTRLVPILTHTLIPLVAYLVLRACKLPPPLAFFGSLVYIANTQFPFFHTTFSYESIGILFFLLTVLFATRLMEPDRGQRVTSTVVLLVSLVAAVLSHHVSGALSVVVVALAALAWRERLTRRRTPLVSAAVFGAVVWFGWLAYQTARTVPYLASNFTGRLTVLLTLLSGEHSETRALFWNSPLPPVERFVAYLYPLLLLGFIIAGVYQLTAQVYPAWRERRQLNITPTQIVFGVIGPLAWLASAPLVITKTSDVVYRSWAFVLIGVAYFAALGLKPWLSKSASRAAGRWSHLAAAYALAGVLLAGGIVVGDNQAGRFRPSEIHSAAGPEAFTADLVDAARWLEADAGRYHPLVGDAASTLGFAVFGMQRTNAWANWLPFYAADPDQAQALLDRIGGEYVAVDLRDTRYYSRYQFYFNAAEFFDPIFRGVSHEDLLSPELLSKFDRMPLLQRVYDDGDIIIYRNLSPNRCVQEQC